MSFNYSYRAFLIATLVAGNLVLLLYSINLSSAKKETHEVYDVELAKQEFIEEKQPEIAALTPKKSENRN